MRKYIFLYIKKGRINSWNTNESMDSTKINLRYENFTMVAPLCKIGLRHFQEDQEAQIIMPRKNIYGKILIIRPDMVVMRNLDYEEPVPTPSKRELDEFIGDSQEEEDKKARDESLWGFNYHPMMPKYQTFNYNDIWGTGATGNTAGSSTVPATGPYRIGRWRNAYS